MRHDHPLARKRLTIDAYCDARHLLVSFSGRPFGFIDEALAALNRTRRVVLTVNQFFTAGRVVVGSDLLTVLPRHFLPSTGMSAELAACELPFAVPKVQVDMVWHQRTRASAAHLYSWAEASSFASPFVADTRQRSSVVGTIDLDDTVPVHDLNAALRANRIVDTDSYRKLGRNQLRVGMFPSVEPDDVASLTACIDHVVSVMVGADA